MFLVLSLSFCSLHLSNEQDIHTSRFQVCSR